MTSPLRADARENREALLAAVERLLREGRPFTLTALSDEAGVSRATTYRNFSSPDDAVEAYIHAFLDSWDERWRADARVGGANEFDAVSEAWIELIAERSHALARTRSSEGFLKRAHGDDPIIGRVYAAVRPAVDKALAAGLLGTAEPDIVVMLWNLLLDPRELIDLAAFRGTSIGAVGRELLGLVYAAARGARPGPPA